jgi:hypothetical protein
VVRIDERLKIVLATSWWDVAPKVRPDTLTRASKRKD